MLDQASANPAMFIGGCVVWIPMSIWMIATIGWMIQGEVSTGFGIGALLLGVALMLFTISPPVPILSPICLGIAILTMVLFPWVRSALNRHEMSQIDGEQAERVYEVLKARPGNMMPVFKLAELMARRGYLIQAAALGDRALTGLSIDHFKSEIFQIKTWKGSLQTHGTNARSHLPCLKCGHKNEPAAIYCDRCHRDFLVDYVGASFVGSDFARKFFTIWIVAVALLLGVPSVFAMLPLGIAALVGVSEFALAAWFVWRVFGGSPRRGVTS